MPKPETKTKGFPSDEGYVPTPADLYAPLVESSPSLEDPGAVAEAITRRLLDADDFDAALDLAEGGTIGARQIIDRPFRIEGVTWYRGSPAYADNGSGVFVLLNVAMDDTTDAEHLAVTCGGENVLALVYRGVMAGAIPSPERRFKFRSVPTSKGFDTLYLVRA